MAAPHVHRPRFGGRCQSWGGTLRAPPGSLTRGGERRGWTGRENRAATGSRYSDAGELTDRSRGQGVARQRDIARKSVGEGKRGSVSVHPGGRRNIKKKKQ